MHWRISINTGLLRIWEIGLFGVVILGNEMQGIAPWRMSKMSPICTWTKPRSSRSKIGWLRKKNETDKARAVEGKIQSYHKRVKRLRTGPGRDQCLLFSYTNTVRSLRIRSDILDRDPYLFGCKNCVVDLKLGERRDGRRDDYITCSCPVDFLEIAEPAPHWGKFLNEIFPDDHDLIEFVAEAFRVCHHRPIK